MYQTLLNGGAAVVSAEGFDHCMCIAHEIVTNQTFVVPQEKAGVLGPTTARDAQWSILYGR